MRHAVVKLWAPLSAGGLGGEVVGVHPWWWQELLGCSVMKAVEVLLAFFSCEGGVCGKGIP